MKPDYKNWMPKGMIYGSAAVTLLFLILFIIFGCTGIVSGSGNDMRSFLDVLYYYRFYYFVDEVTWFSFELNYA